MSAKNSNSAICPSAKCDVNSVVIGVVERTGSITFLPEPVTVDQEFLRIAHQGRTPEKRFRFASTCRKSGCQQWTGSRCGVIDRLTQDNPDFKAETLPDCNLRPDCRWFQQSGASACALCPHVVTDLTENSGLLGEQAASP